MLVPNFPVDLNLECAPAAVADAAELSVLFNAIADADDTPERLSEKSMRHELESYFDPLDGRTVVARDDSGGIVAYATVYSRRAEADEMRAYINVHIGPAWRGRNLEDSLIDWGIKVGTSVLKEAPAERRFVCGWLYKKQEQMAALFAARGFTPIRHWWEMECLLNGSMRPAEAKGFEIVPWHAEHDEPARLVHNAAFADHWGSTPMDSEQWQKHLTSSPGFRREHSFVALGDGEVVGYATVEEYPEDWAAAGRKEAWIGGLGVLREWRQRGIATALLTRAMEAMREAEIEAAMIGVDSESPSGAQHLYRSVGFVTKITGTTWQLEVD
jgi:ribosomal protein S18 acetylase RimI-like enzyme